ncbi:berberine bridge enzyme-like protein 21 [Tanacetum coccineum]
MQMYETFLECLRAQSPQLDPTLHDIIHSPVIDPSAYTAILKSSIRNLRFNTTSTPKPTFIITPIKYSHVQATVLCAKTLGIQLKVRSGGHDYDGISYISSEENFIVLDMQNLHKIDVDIANETATVEAGAHLGELYYRISEKSNVHGFPGGVCPTVGVGGHFSGGGYERKTMGDDLFWAIRGGGGASFGVILSYTVKIVRVPGQVCFYLNPYGGKMNEIREDETPFPHRAGNLFKIQYMMNWVDNDPILGRIYMSQMRGLHIFMTKYVSKNPRCLFLCYRDLDIGTMVGTGASAYESGKVYGEKYFKGNFDRLVKVKTNVDPDNFFRNEQSIPCLHVKAKL